MTPIDEDPQGPGPSPQVLTYGGPHVGEILAERYRLEQHIGDDALGRQLWRGADVILQRPVTVVLRYPGGDSASEMLSAAVAASRIVHPHLVGVYDAIDESERAYVVREWVEGTSLRDVVKDYGPLEADKAVAIGHAVAGAVAALHDTGMAHGNVQPGTVLIGDDGRVVLADARADDAATAEADIRALGAVLYCALTGSWPHAEAGTTTEPDANRDGSGLVIAPHLLRAGVPTALDELTVDLLNPAMTLPSADVLAAELARQDNAEHHRSMFADDAVGLDAFDNAGPTGDGVMPRVSRKLVLIIAAVLVLAVTVTIIAAKSIGGGTAQQPQVSASGTAAPGKPPSGEAALISLTAGQVRVVDASGDGNERKDADRAVDGNASTFWKTDRYDGQANFGNLKQGMGLLLDLGKETSVTAVTLQLGAPGATVELRGGTTDPSNGNPSNAADAALLQAFQPIGPAKTDAGINVVLGGDPDKKVRYVLVWFTKIPPEGDRTFRLKVLEITVRGQQ